MLCVVAFLVIRLQLTDHLSRQILHRHLCVTLEEVFTIDEKALDGFSVPLNRSVVAHFHTRQLFNKRFEGGTRWRAIGRGVEHGCIAHLLHTRGSTSDYGRLQGVLIARQTNDAQINRIIVLRERYHAVGFRIAHKTDAQNIRTRLCHTKFERTNAVGHCPNDFRAIELHQRGRSKLKFVHIALVFHTTRNHIFLGQKCLGYYESEQ